jgi:2-polyprenyl-3-methyl-5-hydroxy-6-metoxy-1,4-benzoquinol methylase
MTPNVGILVVAYNAASTLAQVLDRIPPDVGAQIHEVLVGDDHSQDGTFEVGLDYQAVTHLPLKVVRHPRNLGYGGNQKWGYRYAIDNGWDVVVLLHGDGQYAPEEMRSLLEPILEGRAEAVLGSRLLEPGAARRGGMPLYKYVGNRILTTVQNAVVGTRLSEWHSGYRAYDVAALAGLPFESNSDGFDFDTQIIVQLHEAGLRTVEVPIPTYYGDEICYVDGVKYAQDVTRHVLRYRAHKLGLGSGELAFAAPAPYDLKHAASTSHGRLRDWASVRPQSRILDLGCSDGQLAQCLTDMGHFVVGVDAEEHKFVRDRLAEFHQADLNHGIPEEVGTAYDVVLMADVLEHVADPEMLLVEARERLAPGGVVMVSVPNFGHWYPRARVAAGRFDYDARGILDRGHIRFFTQRSFESLLRRAGWRVTRADAVGLPLEVLDRGGAREGGGRVRRTLGKVDRALVSARPQLFGYQLIYELEPG